MHSLPRYLKKIDINDISATKNLNLRYNGKLIEAGDYYEN